MTVFENMLVAAQHGAGLHGDEAAESALAALRRPAWPHGRAQCRHARPARPQTAGTGAHAGHAPAVLLLDEIGGGLTEAELLQLVDLIDGLRAGGLTIVWIEHVLHALLRVVGRLVCMDAGAVLAEGRRRR